MSMIDLEQYQSEVEREQQAILRYWMQHTLDETNDGFIGRIDGADVRHATAPKGAVLNSRILWAFSVAYNHTKNAQYLEVAERAFDYITHHFIDKKYGGVFWSVDYKGKPLDTKKQVYAIAFAIYGLSEYALASGSEKAKQAALELYDCIEKHSHDNDRGGYIEALTRDWQDITDLRLSEKDANERKSMNTHLHVLEGYANLYRIWPDEVLKKNLVEIIHLFLDHIIDAKSKHLVLFFDDDWQKRSQTISFGHDIEAAWLVQEAAEQVGDTDLITRVKEVSLQIAGAAANGLDSDGGLWYEQEEMHLVKEKHWWVQAEAMVGFLNAWQLSQNPIFLERSFHNWRFVQKYIVDKENGEWFWGVNAEHAVMQTEDKTGLWKCPYHNVRACLEVAKRLRNLKRE